MVGRGRERVDRTLGGGGMRGMTEVVARGLARKSSRRQFFKFMSASSLGTGLALTGSDASLATVLACAGCGGGPCNPCFSPHPPCSVRGKVCRGCAQGGGCPSGCSTTGEWFCCTGLLACEQRCSECSCPLGCCHCFTTTNVSCIAGVPCLCAA